MDERDMEEEKQNGKRKVWRIERKTLFFWNCYFYFLINRANKALSTSTTRVQIYFYWFYFFRPL
jgi:hypothetical protein